MNAVTIAVIIPVRNRPALVLEALESVAAQTRQADAIIVVDDGSTDDTAARVEAWMLSRASTMRTKLIRQAHAGPGAARNRGAASAADCELLAFLDSDDCWPADYLARMEQPFRADPKLVAATCDQRTIDVASQREHLRRYRWLNHNVTQNLLKHGPPGTPNTVFRSTAFREAGGYDEHATYGEDFHLALKLSLRGRWSFVAGAPVIVRKMVRNTNDEADQLSQVTDDRRHQMAVMLQRFIEEEGGCEAVPERVWRRRLARWWLHAGDQVRDLGRAREARDCYDRALRLAPWSIRARWKRFRLKADSSHD